jgi:hypothetical protein
MHTFNEIAIVSKNNVINPHLSLVLNMRIRVKVLIAATQSAHI